jgi:YbbR domain-containing protein
VIDTLGAGSFRAQVSLQGLEPDLHRIPVDVDASARPVQIVSVTPAEVDVQLVQIISRTVGVRLDENSLILPSPALELSGAPVFTPTEVVVSGAAPRVSSVAFATVDAPDLEATGTVQQMQSVNVVDEDGLVVSDVQLNPPSVMVALTLAQRANARDVGVRVITEGALPDGYRLASLLTDPARLTLLGSRQQLNNVGPAIETVPLDLGQVVDDFVLQLPIDLPPGMEAIDPQGETVRAVAVTVDVEERIGNRVMTRTVELEGAIDDRITFDPSTVEIVLNGPVPLLEEIEAQPELLRAVIDVAQFANLPPGQSTTVLPTIIAPDGVRTRVTPARVEVTAP